MITINSIQIGGMSIMAEEEVAIPSAVSLASLPSLLHSPLALLVFLVNLPLLLL